MKKTGIGKKIISISLAMALVVESIALSTSMICAQEPEGQLTTGQSGDKAYVSDRMESSYSRISAAYSAPVYTGETVEFVISEHPAIDMLTDKPAGTVAEISAMNSLTKLSVGDVYRISAEVPATALYRIGFDYISVDESILPIKFGFRVDEEYPFYECRNLSFETTWASYSEMSMDRYGNDIVALPEKVYRWEHKELSDGSYRYSDPLLVELEAGTHEFVIDVCEGSFGLGSITLSAPEVIAPHTSSPKAEGNALIVIEGEDFYLRNDSSIHAAGEFDPRISPQSASVTVLNTVDQDSFDKPGQMITYRFNAEKEGDYYIALNYRQSEKNGFPVFVDYRIDGKMPDAAFRSYPMAYTTKYRTDSLCAEDGNRLSVHLTEGEHTISMQISADNLRYALEETDDIMNGINDLSLEVTKVAGTNKDKYRDLKLTRYIPDVQQRLYDWVDRLTAVAEQACVYTDAKDADDVAAFAYLLIAAKQLKTLGDEPDELIYRVDELATSVNSINTQIANFVDLISKNNLSVDRVYIYQEGAKLPGGLNLFQSLWLSIRRFFNSFFGQSYSVSMTKKDHIQVWVNRPRQYVEIMQKMIDEEFTIDTGIEVDLCLMTDANKLILSNASGDTPDIATGINYSIPFELGIRGALVDLSKFDGYKEVFGRYSDGLLVPSVIGDQLISLPETMNFYVMFCRTDILDKMGLTPPDTMDELIAMLPDLQMRGLNVFYPTAAMLGMRNFHGTTPLIFQNGGRLYGKTAQDVMVDDEEAVAGFTELTELFTLYDLPVDVPNFYQHFRNGDLCIGIADFNSYNLILNAAPEIANSWSISLIPGTKDPESGEVLRYISGGAESMVMFASDDEREKKAWAFMEWWTRTEVQAEFGQRLQIMYGDEYIWPTANLEAFSRLPYPTSDKDVIIEQAGWILEAPRLVGSYMMEREMSNAFNDVVVNGETLRSRVDEVVKIVDRETARKLEEFGYIDADGNVIKEYVIPDTDQVRRILER